jgi:hypothetical protein
MSNPTPATIISPTKAVYPPFIDRYRLWVHRADPTYESVVPPKTAFQAIPAACALFVTRRRILNRDIDAKDAPSHVAVLMEVIDGRSNECTSQREQPTQRNLLKKGYMIVMLPVAL